jgi:hypothetical protein
MWLCGEFVAARAPSRSGRCPAYGNGADGAKHRMIGVGRLYRKGEVHAGRIEASKARRSDQLEGPPKDRVQPFSRRR